MFILLKHFLILFQCFLMRYWERNCVEFYETVAAAFCFTMEIWSFSHKNVVHAWIDLYWLTTNNWWKPYWRPLSNMFVCHCNVFFTSCHKKKTHTQLNQYSVCLPDVYVVRLVFIRWNRFMMLALQGVRVIDWKGLFGVQDRNSTSQFRTQPTFSPLSRLNLCAWKQ